MRIAFVSYEHPKGISGGGIGTYIGQASKVMALRGHEVEVFCASDALNATVESIEHDGYILHFIPTLGREYFRKDILNFFSTRHNKKRFDIIEVPEYGADGLNIKETFKDLPLTLKLHTPSFLTKELNKTDTFVDKSRFVLGGLLRGKLSKPYWNYDKSLDDEYKMFCLADSVSSPSNSLQRIVNLKWDIQREIKILPYPFIPVQNLLNIKSRPVLKNIVVSFIGRLEKRKGVLDLMNAIPRILKENRNIQFRFIGKPLPSPMKGKNMDEFIGQGLKDNIKNVELLGSVSYDKVAQILEETDICIFPSIWENFPNVCLEAMAAGKAVIGTNNGGMADMIQDNVNGLLIMPNSPTAIKRAILNLAHNPEKIASLGREARERILSAYNANKIGEETELFYQATINSKH
jgi:glycosyltransferase involved in cell wall biosynthesis